jgi:hypothetical protein
MRVPVQACRDRKPTGLEKNRKRWRFMLKAREEKLETASRATQQVRPRQMDDAGDAREKIPSKMGGLVKTESM